VRSIDQHEGRKAAIATEWASTGRSYAFDPVVNTRARADSFARHIHQRFRVGDQPLRGVPADPVIVRYRPHPIRKPTAQRNHHLTAGGIGADRPSARTFSGSLMTAVVADRCVGPSSMMTRPQRVSSHASSELVPVKAALHQAGCVRVS
jgi:hypothetical protein